MSIGETLARARRDAGLNLAQMSIRTRIRHDVIEAIEHDDYSACGGDSGTRGAIAALARALHVDFVPLLQAYDADRQPGQWIVSATPSEPVTAAEAPRAVTPPEAFPAAPEPGPGTANDTDTLPILVGEPCEPAMTGGEPPSPSTTDQLSPIPPGGPTYPVTPAGASGSAWPEFADRRQVIWIALGAVLLAVAGLGGILLVLGTSGQAAPHAAVARRDRGSSRGATGPDGTREPAPGHSARSPGPTRPTSPGSRPPVRALAAASIAAFGPGGTGNGDSPQLARQALAGKPAVPWHSSWYTTPHFGNLQNGTGLLLDMGRTVTITSVRIALGGRPGANFALYIGNSPAHASLRPVAHADHAAGVVRLTTVPTRGRYILVWFTRLPPDQAGTFQVSVYDIKLRGYP